MLFLAAVDTPPRPESMKFPIFSLLEGNLRGFCEVARGRQRPAARPTRSIPPRSSSTGSHAVRLERGAWQRAVLYRRRNLITASAAPQGIMIEHRFGSI